MKILYLCETTDVSSGWGRYAHDLIGGVKKQGHEVIVYTTNKRGLAMLVYAWQLRKLVTKENPDIIHALDINPYGIIVWLSRFLGVNTPYVLSIQGTYSIAPLHNIKTKWLSQKTCANAKKIIAISNYSKQLLLQSMPQFAIDVVQHGVNLQEFGQGHETSSEQFIISVGALKRRKGYHVALPAFARVLKEIPDLQYKIIGGDPKKQPWILEMVHDLGIESNVDFLAGISDDELKKLYRTARLFILPSVNDGYHFEGFGLVFLEAAAAGLPVVGTKGNGIEDAVNDGVNGLLVEQENIDMTTDAILDILQNNKHWNDMSSASYKWAQQHDINNTVTKYIDIYKKTK